MKDKELFNDALNWFNAFSIGSLTTSIFFYASYGNWQPMVWSASIVAGLHLFRAAVQLVIGSGI